MKKVLLSLVALSAVALVACGPSKSFTETEKAVNEACAQLDAVTSIDQIATIGGEFETKCAAIVTANGDKMSETETAKIEEITAAMVAKLQVKADSLNQIAAAAAAEAAALAAAEAEALAAATAKPGKKK